MNQELRVDSMMLRRYNLSVIIPYAGLVLSAILLLISTGLEELGRDGVYTVTMSLSIGLVLSYPVYAGIGYILHFKILKMIMTRGYKNKYKYLILSIFYIISYLAFTFVVIYMIYKASLA